MNNLTHQSIKTQLIIASFTKIKENHVIYNMNDFLWASLGCLGSFRYSGFYTSSLNFGNNLCLSTIVRGGVQCSNIFATFKKVIISDLDCFYNEGLETLSSISSLLNIQNSRKTYSATSYTRSLFQTVSCN